MVWVVLILLWIATLGGEGLWIPADLPALCLLC